MSELNYTNKNTDFSADEKVVFCNPRGKCMVCERKC